MGLVFRKLKESDLEAVREWRMLPEVTTYMFTDPEITPEGQKRWYEKISTDPTCAYWIIQADGVDIGLVCLTDIDELNRRVVWAYYIADTSMRGKGIGKQTELNIQHYVFTVLDLNKLSCDPFACNEKVISIHKHLGARIEGVKRSHIYKNERFHDVVEMAILKEEWERLGKDKERVPARFEQ